MFPENGFFSGFCVTNPDLWYPNVCIRQRMNKEKLFREAIEENSQRIFRICCYYFTDPDDRKDAYQESLIRIWENISSFKGNSKISTWIYRIAVNACLAFIRKDKRRNEMFESKNSSEKIGTSDSPAQDDTRETEAKLRFFSQFMNRLSMADRTLVSLYLEEVPSKEMAEITGLSEANVRVKLFRIKDQIKKEWEEKNHGTG